MTAYSVTKPLDVFKDIGLCCCTAGINLFLDLLALKAAKKRFCHGIIPTVGTPADAGA